MMLYIGPVKHDRLLRRVGGVESDCIYQWRWEYILPQLVIFPAPLVYTATMFDALVEAAKRNYCL